MVTSGSIISSRFGRKIKISWLASNFFLPLFLPFSEIATALPLLRCEISYYLSSMKLSNGSGAPWLGPEGLLCRVTSQQRLWSQPWVPVPLAPLCWGQPSRELDRGLWSGWKMAFSFMGTRQQEWLAPRWRGWWTPNLAQAMAPQLKRVTGAQYPAGYFWTTGSESL